MATMRATVMTEPGGPEVLVPTTIERPTPGIGEVLVRVAAAGVNPIDAKTRSGRGVSALIKSYPAVLGVDLVGTVEHAAFDMHPFQPGDTVYGLVSVPRLSGGYAEYVSAPAVTLARAPKTISLAQAGGVPCAALTAWGCITSVGHVQPGQRVLIHAGAGGVGHFAVQFARLAGAHVVTTASAGNAQWLRELGANEVIDYNSERFDEVTSDIDVVVDLIGNVKDDTGTRSLRVMMPGGLLISVPTGSWPTFREDAAAAGMRATDIKAIADTETLTTIAELIDNGEVQVHVEREFALEDAADAHRMIEEGHTRGKIVLRVSDS